MSLAELFWNKLPPASRLVELTRQIVGAAMFEPSVDGSRFRNDDGSESAASFSDAEDTDPVVIVVDVTKRVRFVVNNLDAAAGAEIFQLQRENSTQATGFANVTTTSSHMKSVASADTTWTINDGDATTDQIGGGGTFAAGEMDETGVTGSISIGASGHTEVEYVFQLVSSDVVNLDNINLRLVNDMAQVIDATVVPSITVSEGGAPPATVYPPWPRRQETVIRM